MEDHMTITLQITDNIVESAQDYATRSAPHTSDRNDFHPGGLANKARKMFEGKLGERVFQAWLDTEKTPYVADSSPHNEADRYDFVIAGRTIDVKTFTQDNHLRLLEMD